MNRNLSQVIASTVVLSIVGYAMWPWRGGEQVMWYAHLPEPLSNDFWILVIAVVATVAIGVAMTALGGLRLSSIAIGGTVAYAFWMIVLTLSFSLHDSLPYFLYGQVLVGVVLGSGLATAIGRVRPVGTAPAVRAL